MASSFGHAALAGAFGYSLPNAIRKPLVITIGVLCSIFPDADVLSFRFGIHYGDLWGHRGMTHSLFFAFCFCLLLVNLFHYRSSLKDKLWIYFYYSFCMASHGLLDGMTTGGMGIAYFAPFNETRYFLPFRMIQVSPLSASRFFSEWGIEVLKSEFFYIGIPSLIIVAIAFFKRRIFKA